MQEAQGEAVHPYFTAKAEDVIAGAGGDPAVAGPLARWAQEARRQPPVPGSGVIVGLDGTLLADYVTVKEGLLSVQRITSESQARWGCGFTVLDLASTEIARKAGQPVICVRARDVTTGASR